MVETDTNLIKYRLLPHAAALRSAFFRRAFPARSPSPGRQEHCRLHPAALFRGRRAFPGPPRLSGSAAPFRVRRAFPGPPRFSGAAALFRGRCAFPVAGRFPVSRPSLSRNSGSYRLKMTVFSVRIAIFNIFFLSLRAIVRNRDNYKQNKQITTNFFHANAKQRFH